MTGAVALRSMRWRDIDAVRVIEDDLFPEDPWSEEMFWSELAGIPESRYYVVADAEPEGSEPREGTEATGRPGAPTTPPLAGYAGLMTQPGPEPGTGEAWVQNIAVARAHQRRGLGAVLLTDLVDEAVRRGCAELWLEVRTDNESAQRLYTRFGFEAVGIRRGYYQPGNHDALIMRKDLRKAPA